MIHIPTNIKPDAPAHVMRGRAKKRPDIQVLRRLLVETMWSDYKIFGYRTETVDALAARIRREKAAK